MNSWKMFQILKFMFYQKDKKLLMRVIGLNQVESKRNIMIKEIVKNHLMQKKFKKKDKEQINLKIK